MLDILTKDNTIWCHKEGFDLIIAGDNPSVGECLLEEGIGKEWNLFAFEEFNLAKVFFDNNHIKYLPFYHGIMC
jgi:hypothetical protein